MADAIITIGVVKWAHSVTATIGCFEGVRAEFHQPDIAGEERQQKQGRGDEPSHRYADHIKPGMEIAQKAHQQGLQALADAAFRRRGLALSLIVIGLAIVAIYLKVREIESR